jgi:hypothetical protein
MNLNKKEFVDMLDQRARRERQNSVRPVLVQGRRAESQVDPTELPVRETLRLRDPDTGEFWFVVGYSTIGGPDVVAP